jgi:hypothetical protein
LANLPGRPAEVSNDSGDKNLAVEAQQMQQQPYGGKNEAHSLSNKE